MTKEGLVNCLEGILDKIRADASLIEHQPKRAVTVDVAIVKPFALALGKHSDIARLHGNWVQTENHGGLIDLDQMANQLVVRAIALGSAAVIDDAIRFALTGEVDIATVRLVEGATVERAVALDHNITIETLTTVPSASIVSHLLSKENVPDHGWGKPPSCALVVRERVHIPLQPAPTAGQSTPPTTYSSNSEQLMWQAMNAIVLCSTGAPQLRQGYEIVTSPGWPLRDCAGGGDARGFPVHVPFERAVDETRVASVFQKLQLLGHDESLLMAMSKLVSSRRMSNAGQVIELGTCLEVLLTHGQGHSSEIGYKLGTRAAWLLGDNAESRGFIFKRAKNLYDARSKAVHAGVLNEAYGSPAYREALDSYDDLCRELIIVLLSSTFWTSTPEWQLLVVGGVTGHGV